MVPAYYNDNDEFCCRVLRKQISLGNLPPGDVDERDIREVKAEDLKGYGHVHLFAGIGGFPLGFMRAGVPDDWRIVTGGFPCQDISWAGNGGGLSGARSGLWFEYARVLRFFRPMFAVVENSAALLKRGLGIVLRDLAGVGLDAVWDVLSACAFGAPHMRRRVFIMAYANSINGWQGVRDSLARPDRTLQAIDGTPRARTRWQARVENPSALYGGADGVSAGFHRNHAIGNSICPDITEWLGQRIVSAVKSATAPEGTGDYERE